MGGWNTPDTLLVLAFLACWAKRLSWQEAARTFGTSRATVSRSIRANVFWDGHPRGIGDWNAVPLPYMAYRRNHQHLTLVDPVDASCCGLLDLAIYRPEEELHVFCDVLPDNPFVNSVSLFHRHFPSVEERDCSASE